MAEDTEDGDSNNRNETIKILSHMSNINKKTGYLNSNTKKSFTPLRQVFTQPPIFLYFDLEEYILIEINTSGYAINKILNQFTLDSFYRWHPLFYFSRKMILDQT